MDDYPERHGCEWTVEEMLLLAELYLEPITWNTIAREMKRTESACQARLRLMRLACELSPHLSGITILKTIRRNDGQKTTKKMEKGVLKAEADPGRGNVSEGESHRDDASGERNIDGTAIRHGEKSCSSDKQIRLCPGL